MYCPSAFIETDREEIKRFIQHFPLATMICNGKAGLEVNHIPLLFEEGNSAMQEPDYLVGHFAKANPSWQNADEDWVIVFADNGSYISPNWYLSKAVTHKEVPTWNYRAIHIRGKMHLIKDSLEQKLAVLEQLTQHFEQISPQPWQLSDAPHEFLTQLAKAIIAFKFEITDIEGKFKLNQNKTPENIAGVVKGLKTLATPQAQEMAAVMETQLK